MIGLSTINCLNGGTGRLAPTATATMVMLMVAGAYEILNYIPVAALTGIMIVVVLHTFKWFSVRIVIAAFFPEPLRSKLDKSGLDRAEVLVIAAVTLITITSNLVYAVFA